jgi:hypothetical protein
MNKKLAGFSLYEVSLEGSISSGGGTSPPITLNFSVEPQLGRDWCWAAVASSVSRFFDDATTWSQCSIASAELGKACCPAQRNGPCDHPWWLDKALKCTGNLGSFLDGAIDEAAIRIQLGLKRPIGLRVGWSTGGGHFLAIRAIKTDTTGQLIITTTDPIFGESELSLAELESRYREVGTWTHTYYTVGVL